MNCINLKQKLNRKIYCKILKKEISYDDCKNCHSKEFKTINEPYKFKKSRKNRKLERNRFSIIYDDLTKCAECGSIYNISINEVFEGAKRGVSMRYGLTVPFCEECHRRFHNDRSFASTYKKLFQDEFEKTHTREEFIDIAHRNYK